MTKLTNINQSHKTYRKHKSENGRTRTSEYIRGGITCLGGVSIPCRRFTTGVSPISRLIKRYEPLSNSVCLERLMIGMKHIRQHVAHRKIVWINKTIVTIDDKFAEFCLQRKLLKPLQHQLVCQ
jgi:hypothetical protein